MKRIRLTYCIWPVCSSAFRRTGTPVRAAVAEDHNAVRERSPGRLKAELQTRPRRCSSFLPAALALLLLLFTSPLAFSQNLTLNTSTTIISIPLLASDYDLVSGSATGIVTAANTFAIKSTSSTWTLSVRAQSATFSFTPTLGDTNPNKPCGDLAVRENGTASWVPVSTVNQVAATGPKQNLTAPPKQLPMDYRFSSNLQTDPPGNYSVTLIWTLTNP